MKCLVPFVFLLFVLSSVHAQSGLVINEIMSANKTAVADENGDFDDWIELFNNTGTAIDMSGYGLSDDANSLGKFKIPSGTTIEGNGYLIIWADDDQEQGPLHAQFKLSGSGETVFLTDVNNGIIDEVNFGEIPEDKSYARDPNGSGNFVVKGHTHAMNNDLVSGVQPSLFDQFSFYPNPISDFLILEGNLSDEKVTFSIIDLLGKVRIESVQINIKQKIDLSDLETGLYFLSIYGYKSEIISIQK